MPKVLLPLPALVLLTGCIIVVGDDFHDEEDVLYEQRSLSLAAADVDSLAAVTGAGDLKIIGEEGRDSIELSAAIRYVEADDIDLSLERSGSRARLVAQLRHDSRHGGWAHIDLVLRVPARLNLDLEDGSGAISIRGVQGKVLLEDGSGDLLLSGASSAIIKDRSGQIVVEQVRGDVVIDDGSGDIHVREVGGMVSIDDGSGDINVTAAGGLDIIDDGSGDTHIKDISGRVNL